MKHGRISIIFYMIFFVNIVIAALAIAELLGYRYDFVIPATMFLNLCLLCLFMNSLTSLRSREKLAIKKGKEISEAIRRLNTERDSFEEEKQSFDNRRKSLVEEIESLKGQAIQYAALDRTRRDEVERLAALREIHNAASLEQDFEHILYEVMSRVHTFLSAEESTLYLIDGDSARPYPQAYFSRSKNAEQFAFFTVNIEEDDPQFSGRQTVREKNVLWGTLLLEDTVVGSVKISVAGHSRTPRSTLEELFQKEVNDLALDRSSVFDAVEFNNVFRVQTSEYLDVIAPLVFEGTVIGAFKIRIKPTDDANYLEAYEDRLKAYLREISSLIRKEELREKAVRDGLTRLFNKTHFQDMLEKLFAAARGSRKPLSLLMLDIDHFKKINDTYGHLTGDIVLRKVAALLQDGMRSERDIVCRYGGEEVGILLPDTELKGAAALADRLRKAVEKETFIAVDGRELSVTISIGASQTATAIKRSVELVSAADSALYNAKESGRNKVCISGKA